MQKGNQIDITGPTAQKALLKNIPVKSIEKFTKLKGNDFEISKKKILPFISV